MVLDSLRCTYVRPLAFNVDSGDTVQVCAYITRSSLRSIYCLFLYFFFLLVPINFFWQHVCFYNKNFGF